MSHAVKVSEHTTLAHCDDCGSEHLAPVPCGMTFIQRLRSVNLDGSVTETREKRRYWSSEGMNEMFGNTEAERREELMEDTKGIGYVDDLNSPKAHELAKAIGIDAD